MEDYQDKFIEEFKNGNIFFFAGSGISFASNLPSASMILGHTLDVFLPKKCAKEAILQKIQPEVVYEVLLHMTEGLECLELWKSLNPVVQSKYNIKCEPSFMHKLIVKYSMMHKLPVITTNFDLMFEEACAELKISYKVYLSDDSPPKEFDRLAICKLHGSIDKDEEKALTNLRTTMTEITKIRYDWLKFIFELMESKYLCIVGYSGRDIDIFPFLAEKNKNLKNRNNVSRIFWINKFNNDYSDKASEICKAMKINSWPSDFFSNNKELNIIQSYEQGAKNKHEKSNIDQLLLKLKQKLREKRLLTITEKKLFYCILLYKIGYHSEAYSLIERIKAKNNLRFNKEENKFFMMTIYAKLSHEIADFSSVKKSAKYIKNKCKPYINSSINIPFNWLDYLIIANCLIVESYRMSFPYDIYFIKKKDKKFFYQIKNIIKIFSTVDNMIKRYDISNLSVYAKHELLEHKIRFLAFIQSILQLFNDIIKEVLINNWNDIKSICYKEGYADGIANCDKYKFRLTRSEESKIDSSRIYDLLTSATGKELILRNEAEKLLYESKYNESSKKFKELAESAEKSGNILNEIKALLGIAYVNYLTKKSPLLTNEYKDRLIELVDKISSKPLKEYLEYVLNIYLNNNKDIKMDSHLNENLNIIDILIDNCYLDNLINKIFYPSQNNNNNNYNNNNNNNNNNN